MADNLRAHVGNTDDKTGTGPCAPRAKNCICETFLAGITVVKCPTHGTVRPLDPEKARGFRELCMALDFRDWLMDEDEEYGMANSL